MSARETRRETGRRYSAGTGTTARSTYSHAMDGADRFMFYGLLVIFLSLLPGFVVALFVG